jgi:uncharacterized membrane protein
MTQSTSNQLIASDYSPPQPGKATPKWWARPWIVPLVALILGFLSYQVDNFWGVWDTSRAPVSPHPGFALYFPLLAGHMTGGFIAMFTVAIQLWPRMRRRHPRLHRVSGRIYVVAALFSGTCALSIVRFAPASGKIGIILATLMWMITSVVALILGWRGKYEMHRRFALYSFATLMSVIWGVPIVRIGLALPVTITPTYLAYLTESSRWVGWLIDIMIVQWWLLRTAPRYAAAPLRGRKSKPGDVALPVPEKVA